MLPECVSKMDRMLYDNLLVNEEQPGLPQIVEIQHHSSIQKVLSVTAYTLKFINNPLRTKSGANPAVLLPHLLLRR